MRRFGSKKGGGDCAVAARDPGQHRYSDQLPRSTNLAGRGALDKQRHPIEQRAVLRFAIGIPSLLCPDVRRRRQVG